MVQARRLIGNVEGVASLAQGTTLQRCLTRHQLHLASWAVAYNDRLCMCRCQATCEEALLHAGAVFWGPPRGAIADAVAHAHEPLYSAYGPDEGLPELRAALQRKIEQENNLRGVRHAPSSAF